MKTKAIEKLLETLEGCREFMRLECEVIEDKIDPNGVSIRGGRVYVGGSSGLPESIRQEAEEKASRLERYYKNKDLIEEGIKFLSSQVEYSKENKDE